MRANETYTKDWFFDQKHEAAIPLLKE